MMTVERMRKRLKIITNDFRSKPEPSSSDSKKLEIATLIAKTRGINTDSGRAECELLKLTKDLDVLKEYNSLARSNRLNPAFYGQTFVCIVPLRSYNGHNYLINEPVIQFYCNNDSYAIRKNGSVGNSLSVGNATSTELLRLATDEEIDNMPDTQIQSFINYYLGVV